MVASSRLRKRSGRRRASAIRRWPPTEFIALGVERSSEAARLLRAVPENAFAGLTELLALALLTAHEERAHAWLVDAAEVRSEALRKARAALGTAEKQMRIATRHGGAADEERAVDTIAALHATVARVLAMEPDAQLLRAAAAGGLGVWPGVVAVRKKPHSWRTAALRAARALGIGRPTAQALIDAAARKGRAHDGSAKPLPSAIVALANRAVARLGDAGLIVSRRPL
jgi:hypothetical protein